MEFWLEPGRLDLARGQVLFRRGQKVVVNDTDHSLLLDRSESRRNRGATRVGVDEFHARKPVSLHGPLPRSEPRSRPKQPRGRRARLPTGNRCARRWAKRGRIALQMNLAAMVPKGELARPNTALLIRDVNTCSTCPKEARPLSTLSGHGPFRAQWMNPAEGTTTMGDAIAGGARRSFSRPFAAMPSCISATYHESAPDGPGGGFRFTPRNTGSRTPHEIPQIRLRWLVIGSAVDGHRGHRAGPGRSAG